MTLTSLLPTLRDSIPAPFEETAWPAGAHASPRDVVISGVSMLRLAEICEEAAALILPVEIRNPATQPG